MEMVLELPVFSKGNLQMKNLSLDIAPGLLPMVNSGPSTNGCQFFITSSKCNQLDGKHVVFGKITERLLAIRKIENVLQGPNNKPKLPVMISQ